MGLEDDYTFTSTEKPKEFPDKNEIFKGTGVMMGEAFEPSPFTPVVPQSLLDLELRKAQDADREAGFFTGFGVGVAEEHLGSTFVRSVLRGDFASSADKPVDEITDELRETLTKGLENDPVAIEDVFQAATTVSLDYANNLANDYRYTNANLQQLSEAGITGQLGYVLAALGDPVELGLIAGTSAAATALTTPAGGAVAAVGATAGVLGRRSYTAGKAFMKAAPLYALESAAFESLRAKAKYNVDADDVIFAALTGGVFGGSIDAATANMRKNRTLRIIEDKKILGQDLEPWEQNFYDEFGGDSQIQQIISDAENRGDFLEPEDRPLLEPFTEAEANAARKARTIWGTKKLTSRLSVVAFLKQSENGFSRLAADKLGRNSRGNELASDGTRVATNPSAADVKQMLEMRYRYDFARVMTFYRQKWLKRTGGKVTDFNQIVSRAIRGDTSELTEEVQGVIDHVLKSEKELGQLAIKYNVAGFTPDILSRHANYLPRLFRQEKIADLKARYGSEAENIVTRLVVEAIRRGQPKLKLSAKKLERMARGYSRTLLNPEYHAGHRALEFNVEDLEKILREDGLNDVDIADVIDTLTGSKTVKAFKRARPRVVLDELTSIEVEDATGTVRTLRFTDLLEEDIENIHNAYIFQMSGAIGLARNGINTNQAGTTIESLKTKVTNKANELNLSAEVTKRELDAIQFMYDGITGRLGFEDGMSLDMKRFLQRVREYTFSSAMGMSGFSALMELSNVLFDTSIRTLISSVPELRKIISKTASGNFSWELTEEMAMGSGLGGDAITGKFTRAARIDGETLDVADVGAATKFDEFLGYARERTSFLSGLSGITAVLRRLSNRNYAYDWLYAAQKGKQPFKDIEMEQLGIDTVRRPNANGELQPSMADRISTMINKHATFTNKRKTRLEALNTKDWDDIEARDIFFMSAFKKGTQSVQEVSMGSVNKHLRGDYGKSLFQFLSFPLAAVEQQTMRLGIRALNGDAATVSKIFLSASFMGVTLYIARVHINAAGRSDREEYLERAMQPHNIVLGAMSQIGMLSVFGIAKNLIDGAMTGDVTNGITPAAFSVGQKLFSGAYGSARDLEFNEKDVRNLGQALPWASLLPAKVILNSLAAQLPE